MSNRLSPANGCPDCGPAGEEATRPSPVGVCRTAGEARMKTVTYAPTAWDSTRPRDLPPLDETRLSATERAIRRWPLQGRGVQCREFLPGTFAEDGVDQLREMDEEEISRIQAEDPENDGALTIEWGSLRNPVLVLNAIGRVAVFFAFAGGGSVR